MNRLGLAMGAALFLGAPWLACDANGDRTDADASGAVGPELAPAGVGKADGQVLRPIAFGESKSGLIGAPGGALAFADSWEFEAAPGATFEVRLDIDVDPGAARPGVLALFGQRGANGAGHLNVLGDHPANPGVRYLIEPNREAKPLGTYDLESGFSVTMVHTATYGSKSTPFEIVVGWNAEAERAIGFAYTLTLTCTRPEGCGLPEAGTCQATTEAALAVYDETYASELSFVYFDGTRCVERAGLCTAPWCHTLTYRTMGACEAVCPGATPAEPVEPEPGEPTEPGEPPKPEDLCTAPTCGAGQAACDEGWACFAVARCGAAICTSFAEACAAADCPVDHCQMADTWPLQITCE